MSLLPEPPVEPKTAAVGPNEPPATLPEISVEPEKEPSTLPTPNPATPTNTPANFVDGEKGKSAVTPQSAEEMTAKLVADLTARAEEETKKILAQAGEKTQETLNKFAQSIAGGVPEILKAHTDGGADGTGSSGGAHLPANADEARRQVEEMGHQAVDNLSIWVSEKTPLLKKEGESGNGEETKRCPCCTIM
eukprot:comp23660_c4_seq2/m.40445 comp23660_c4_seq2/g.40445  ORF comp23660_c4_seq2/g.40445 comp23660_c4_seq2/m.40445 type:complete len:192 (-) comp23660_c4_seq2:112-687(-)